MSAMGQKRQKQYTAEFKRNAVRMVAEGDRPIADVARELGIPYGGLYEWVRKAQGNARPGHGAPLVVKTEEQRELDRLRKENDELRMELEFAKKAAAFFAKHSK
jgi:transposase